MIDNKKHDFNEIVDRTNTDSYKWDYEGQNGKFIPLGVADTDFKAPIEITNVLREKVDFGIYAYGYLPQKRFSDAVVNWYKTRYGLEVENKNIRHAQGLMTGALWMFLDAYTRPGDKILIQPPVYSTFKVVIEGAGRFVENNNLIYKNGEYEIDFDDLEEKTKDPKVRILLFCNPHNPVGRVWTRAELNKVYEICKRNDVIILSDEAHGDLVYSPNKHIPFFDIVKEDEDKVIVMNGPAKTFNLASFYTAYVMSKNETLIEQYDVVYNNYHFDYNYFGMEAFTTAYNECGYYVDQELEYLENNIDYVIEYLKEKMPKMRVTKPEGTYLLWVNCNDMNFSQQELMEFFESAGVRVNNGANYGENGIGFVRINVACPKATLEKALEQIYEKYMLLFN